MAEGGHGSAPGHGGHAPKPLSAKEKMQNRLLLLGVFVLIAFGLAVPTYVLFDNGDHKASEGPKGMHLDKEEVAGRELFSKTCFYCHALADVKSYGRTGPDLDVVLKNLDTKERQEFVEEAIEQGENHGIGQMPALLYQGKEAKQVAKFVAAVAGVGVSGDTVEPVGYPELISKSESEASIAAERASETKLTTAEVAKGKEIFSTDCSACHTLKAAEATGTIGPDLDRLEPRLQTVEAQVITGGGVMPRFGKEHLLKPAEIEAVAKFVSAEARDN